MSRLSPLSPCHGCEKRKQTTKWFLSQLGKRYVTFEEFAYNVALTILQTCAVCGRECLESMPDDTARQFHSYVQTLVASEGLGPFVRPFLVNFKCEEEISRVRTEVEPKVTWLREATTQRLNEK